MRAGAFGRFAGILLVTGAAFAGEITAGYLRLAATTGFLAAGGAGGQKDGALPGGATLNNDTDDPNDPTHPDFDLSEAGGPVYHYDLPAKPWYLRRWVLMLVAMAVIAALVLTLLPR